jgi:hypothetical protein
MLRAAVIVLLIALSPAHAEGRIALLIGSEAYASEIGRLSNPHNAVALLEQALEGPGFEVAVAKDAGLGALTCAANAYARRVQAAGPGAWASCGVSNWPDTACLGVADLRLSLGLLAPRSGDALEANLAAPDATLVDRIRSPQCRQIG